MFFERIQPLSNVHLLFVSVYQRMTDFVQTLAYASVIRNSVTGVLCKVSMKCHSGLVMGLRGKCENKATSEKVYNMWTKLSKKPTCRKPIIKEFLLDKDGHGTPQITCVTSGFPAPEITLEHNKTKQRLTVPGLEESNTTSITQPNVKPGLYVCKQ